MNYSSKIHIGIVWNKPRRKVRSQNKRNFVNEAAILAGVWGVPNKQSECAWRTKRDREYPKGYSLSLLAGVIGTFEEEFLEPCSSYNNSANAWCDSSYSHSYRQYLHFMLGVDVDEISNFSDIL